MPPLVPLHALPLCQVCTAAGRGRPVALFCLVECDIIGVGQWGSANTAYSGQSPSTSRRPFEPRLPYSRVPLRAPRRQAGLAATGRGCIRKGRLAVRWSGSPTRRTPKPNVYHFASSTSSSSLPPFGLGRRGLFTSLCFKGSDHRAGNCRPLSNGQVSLSLHFFSLAWASSAFGDRFAFASCRLNSPVSYLTSSFRDVHLPPCE